MELIIDFPHSPRGLHVSFDVESQTMFFKKASPEHRNDLWHTKRELLSFRFEARKLILETARYGTLTIKWWLNWPPDSLVGRKLHSHNHCIEAHNITFRPPLLWVGWDTVQSTIQVQTVIAISRNFIKRLKWRKRVIVSYPSIFQFDWWFGKIPGFLPLLREVWFFRKETADPISGHFSAPPR